MPNFEVTVPHTLGKEAAQERLAGFASQIEQAYGDKIKDFQQQPTDNGVDFGFKTLGFRIEGSLIVEESSVRVEGSLPFAVAMAKGQITASIEDRLKKLLT